MTQKSKTLTASQLRRAAQKTLKKWASQDTREIIAAIVAGNH